MTDHVHEALTAIALAHGHDRVTAEKFARAALQLAREAPGIQYPVQALHQLLAVAAAYPPPPKRQPWWRRALARLR